MTDASVPIEQRPLTSAHHYWRLNVLISTYFAYAGFYLTRKVFTVCKKTLAEDYGIGFPGVAQIWTTFLIGYMLGQFINSFIGRRWGPRVLLLGGLGLSIVINVIFGFANSYPTFMVFMFFNGLVQAAGWPGSVGGVAEWLRRSERGTIMGVWSTNYALGSIVVKTLGGYLLFHYGVRYSFWGCTVVAALIWMLVYLCQRDRPEDVGLSPIVDHGQGADAVTHVSAQPSVTWRDYVQILANPAVLMMGTAYFSIKYMRYALDSWLPTFLALQGLDPASSAYYSTIFDTAGLFGAVVAGFAMDRFLRGRWDLICVLMGAGMVAGYVAVLRYGSNPISLAFCFGIVGFMLYGPDTILGGVGCVAVAGQRNAVAVAGIVNGLGSIGPILQETVNGKILAAHVPTVALWRSNVMGLSMSICFLLFMCFVTWRIELAKRAARLGVQ